MQTMHFSTEEAFGSLGCKPFSRRCHGLNKVLTSLLLHFFASTTLLKLDLVPLTKYNIKIEVVFQTGLRFPLHVLGLLAKV